MKKILFLAAVCLVSLVNAQVDVFESGVLSIGLGTRQGSFSGLLMRQPLSVTQSQWGSASPDLTPFHFNGLSTDIKLVTFDEGDVLSINADGLLYLLSGIPYTKDLTQLKLKKWAATPVTELQGKGNWSDYQTMLWNWRLVDMNGVFGKHAIGAGFHLSIRSIGLPSFTWYQMPGENNWVMQQGSALQAKIFGGVTVGYRQNFGKLAVFVVGGLNSCANHNSETAIKLNPFIKPTIYFGGKRGLTLSAYYEQYKGTLYTNASSKSNPVPLKLNNLEICLGIYVGGK